MPLLWISLAFLTGILLQAWLELPYLGWAAVLGVFLIGRVGLLHARKIYTHAAGFVRFVLNRIPFCIIQAWIWLQGSANRLRLPVPILVLVLAAALGGLRYQGQLPDLDDPVFIASHVSDINDVVIEGVVVSPPDVRDHYTNLRVQTDSLRNQSEWDEQAVYGLLLVRAQASREWHYGDRVRIEGLLESPPEGDDFSYRDYLARQGIYAYIGDARVVSILHGQGGWMKGALFALKERALATVYRLFPDPEASLLAGIVLGVESGISDDVMQVFRDTGTAHIIAISGFNMTIIAGLLSVFFGRWLGRWRGAVAALIGIALYTILVGAEAAVLRAAIMGGLTLFARQLGRRQDGLNTLAIVAALMALADPNVLWDVGFQLSFAATLGLVLYAEPLADIFVRFAVRFIPAETAERLAGPVGEYFLFTLAAQITTLPVAIYHFQRLSLSAFLVNPLILPVQPAVMILGGAAIALGIVIPPLGKLLANLAWPFAAYTIRIVTLFSTLPGGVIAFGRIALAWVFIFYIILLLIPVIRQHIPGWRVSLKPALILLILVGLNSVVWQSVMHAPDGKLHLIMLDVSGAGRSGDGLLIRSPGGRYVLVNGGPSTISLSTSLGHFLPPGLRQLDYLVVAAPDEDQIASLPRILPRYRPQQVLWAGSTHAGRSARALQRWFADQGLRPELAEAGQKIDLGDGAQLEVQAVNARGAVLLLTWGRFRALLPVGQDFSALEELQNDPALTPVTILLLAESGYAPVNPPEWTGKLMPQLALLSVAADDRDGLPSPETLAALQGYTLLRTDRNGWIELSTDGEQMWVEVEMR